MLSFFPTPYPDELWYSVLCRYHVRSGNPTSAATFRELFGDRDNAALASFLPNDMIYKIAKQLPDRLIDVEDIALNHTLFKYLFRFQPLETKHKLLVMAKKGKIDFPVHLPKAYKSRELKICPMCMREDIRQYGEPYWHLSHQIPHMLVCRKHGCRLNSRKLKGNKVNNNFILPDNRDMDMVDTSVPQMEIKLAEMLACYLELPLETGPTEGYSNLYEGLLNAGYGIARKDNYYSVDYKNVDRDMKAMFGQECIAQYFGCEDLRAAIFGGIRYWKYKMPERYAILAVFLGQRPETTFGKTRIENETSKRFLELSQSNVVRSKKWVAEKLGITELQLGILSHNLGVEPFWRQKPDADNPKERKIYLGMTKSEWEYVETCTRKYQFSCVSEFIRFCIEQTKTGEFQYMVSRENGLS